MLTLVVMMVLGQVRPDTVMDDRLHDAAFFRRVLEAKMQADQWASKKAEELFPQFEITATAYRNPYLSRELWNRRQSAKPVLKSYAYRQVMQAYDLSEKEFRRATSDPRIAALPHVPEPNVWSKDKRPIRMVQDQWAFVYTRFDPSKVKIPPKVARKIRYVNPTESDEAKLKRYAEEAKGQNPNPGTHGEVFTSKGP